MYFGVGAYQNTAEERDIVGFMFSQIARNTQMLALTTLQGGDIYNEGIRLQASSGVVLPSWPPN